MVFGVEMEDSGREDDVFGVRVCDYAVMCVWRRVD